MRSESNGTGWRTVVCRFCTAAPTAAFVLGLLGLFQSSQATLYAADSPRKPNIVVIVADDLGYGDIGCQGGQDIPTPNLDSLAREGVRCSSGYVSCPVCSPTRAGLLTGRYQQRFGFEFNGDGPKFGLPEEEQTIAGLLKPAGYATMAIGKWHLGTSPQFRPHRRGFDEYYGFLGGGRSYLPLKDSVGVPYIPRDPPAITLFRNDKAVDDPPHLTKAFGDEAAAFIDRNRNRPFLLYVAFNAVHVPLQAPNQYLDRFPDLQGDRRTYAAMLSEMDDAVGTVRAKLREAGLEQDTLVFFLSDNGGHPPLNAASNHPLRGQKGTLYEGGVRVPFFVKWPGHIPAGKIYSQPVICQDILSTSLAVAGVKPPTDLQLDGVDLLPALSGKADRPPHETLYWRVGEFRAIRHGRWKLVMSANTPPGLYDLETDLSETRDLSAEQPQVLAQLQNLFAEWAATLPEPRWGPLALEKKKKAGQGAAKGVP
ncbi:MAG: sulfatase [Planctomycetaceae bacterium]